MGYMKGFAAAQAAYDNMLPSEYDEPEAPECECCGAEMSRPEYGKDDKWVCDTCETVILDDDGDYGDYLYEQEKDRRLGL